MPVQLQSFLWPPILPYSSYLVTSGQWYSWVKFNTALMLIKELACFPQCATGLLPSPWIFYCLGQTLTLWSGTRSLQAVTQCYKLRKQKYINPSGQSHIWRCIPNARVTEPQKQCQTWTAGTGEWTPGVGHRWHSGSTVAGWRWGEHTAGCNASFGSLHSTSPGCQCNLHTAALYWPSHQSDWLTT